MPGRNSNSKSRPSLPLIAELIVLKLLQPVPRALFRPGAGLNADCALRMRACLQGTFPKVRPHHDGLPSPLRRPTLHTQPLEGARDGSVLPVRIDAWRAGIGSQPPRGGNPPKRFLVAVQRARVVANCEQTRMNKS